MHRSLDPRRPRRSWKQHSSVSAVLLLSIGFLLVTFLERCAPVVSGFSLSGLPRAPGLHPLGSHARSKAFAPAPQPFTVVHTAPPRRALEGMPSAPGWKRGQLDKLTEWAVADEANRPIICEYEPDGLWLWTKWRGTVLSLTVIPVLLNMAAGGGIDYYVHTFSGTAFDILAVPPADDPFIQDLQGINKLWEYQLTLCTFILTFFTSEAYKHWRSVYFTTRAIQGRVNDVCMLITVAAERDDSPEVVQADESSIDRVRRGIASSYSAEAEDLVQVCTRLVKLSHTFFWAATPTCSNGLGDALLDADDEPLPAAKLSDIEIGPLLLSADGLLGLVHAGELTREERAALLRSGMPPSQYTYILLEWVGLYAMAGLRDGTLRGGAGLEENLLRQLTSLRAEYFTIGDYTAGRMVVAYVQLVQVLVDSLVYVSPLALYPELGTLSIPATGLLTLFYKGLLELSKSFLDPFGNEGYPGQNIRVDVLVSELNFGAANRWVRAGQTLPRVPKRQSKS